MIEALSQTIWLVPLYALIWAILAIPWSPGIIRETGPRPSGYVNLLMTFIALIHSLVALVLDFGQKKFVSVKYTLN